MEKVTMSSQTIIVVTVIIELCIGFYAMARGTMVKSHRSHYTPV